MKKLFLSLMLVAAVAAGFISCTKDNNESDTHTQTFTLGETNYHVDNAITIENIKNDNIDGVYNAIVMSTGKLIGETSGEGQSIIILFRDNITAGTYALTTNDDRYPRYYFAEMAVEDIVNFDMEDLMAQDDLYQASNGSFTLEINDSKYIITTDGIAVEKLSDQSIALSSSVDFEGTFRHYVLADVDEGTLNDGENIAEVVTAGHFSYSLMMLGKTNIAAFITAAGDMIGFTFDTEEFPTETLSTYVLYVNGMNLSTTSFPTIAQNIEVNISVGANDVYTIDINEVSLDGKTYTLHYVGTMPGFDFPFQS